MSRIGQKPINLPENITARVSDNKVTVKSSKTSISQIIPEKIKVEVKGNQVIVSRSDDVRQTKALHGLIRSLIANMVIGVTDGFQKTLELQGTGYRVSQKGAGIELSLGFSHPVSYEPLENIKLEVKDQKIIVISGIDKQLVGQTAAEIRAFKSPDAYKGKGIRYQDEVVKLKPGKAAKAGEGGSE